MPAVLSHRERVKRTIERKDIDKIPFFFRADQYVSDMIMKKHKLADDQGILSYYDADAVHVQLSFRKESLKQMNEDGTFYDIYGNKHRRVENNNYTTSTVVEPVLAGASTIDDIDALQWPDSRVIDLEESSRRIIQAHSSGLAVYSGAWASIFTAPKSMVGEEDFLIALIDNEDFILKLIERTTDYFIDINELFFSMLGQYVDVFYFGSDFGTQSSMFISQDMFRKYFKPSIARLTRHAKGFGLKVMYHTCGAVGEIIPDLIDCGVDILDPIQVSAANMSPEILARYYKGKIVFHGGISSQKTLPFANPEMVRAEVINCIKTLGPLGYIASPDQEMIGDIPIENIDMMCKTISEYVV